MSSEMRSRRAKRVPALEVDTKEEKPVPLAPSPAPLAASNAFRASREQDLEGMLLFKEEPRQFLFLFLLALVVAHYSFTHDSNDFALNVRNGLFSASFTFLAYCFLQTRDGLLVRPHPGVWRVVHGISVLYLLLLASLSVQNLESATAAIKVLFPEVGGPAKVKPSAPLNCEINSTSLYRGVSSIWFLAHVTGWWGKMCMFRDWRFCWVLGISFELLELIFQFVIPDFQECWWDSLFMDLFGANFIGMCLGHLTLKYLETKEYDWSGNRGDKPGVVRRALCQFTPFSWSRYDWEVFSSFKRFALVAVAVFVCLLVELNAFFLLSTLNIPKESHINKYRLCLIFMLGIPAASEYYEFITNPACWRLGQNAWMMCSIGVFEVLVWVKFAHGLAGSTTPPPDVYLPLLAFGFLFSLWMLLFFSKTPSSNANTRFSVLDVLYYLSFTPLLFLTKQWACDDCACPDNQMSQISSGREDGADDGEENAWLSEVKAMHKEILKHELAWPFLEPVDPVKLNIPSYFQIIERPMDLGTINTRLQMATGDDQDEMANVFGPPTAMMTYNSLEEYKQDLLLVFDNAVKFNGDDGRVESVGNMAKRMRQHVLALLAERFSVACLTWEEKVELNLLQKMIHQAKVQKVRENWKKDSFVARWNRQKIETRIESLMQANQ